MALPFNRQLNQPVGIRSVQGMIERWDGGRDKHVPPKADVTIRSLGVESRCHANPFGCLRPVGKEKRDESARKAVPGRPSAAPEGPGQEVR